MKLSDEEFSFVVQKTCLFAIDLIIINPENKILLGERKNSPAQNYWFVPGGRVYKGESLSSALKRISKSEIGIELNKNHIKFHGLYDHMYPDNFLSSFDFDTHYIILACTSHIQERSIELDDQHLRYKFWSKKDLLESPCVHEYTKSYFIDRADNLFLQCNNSNI